MNKEEIKIILSNGLHSVNFTKVDGSSRTLICTIDTRLIPHYEHKGKLESDDMLSVWVPDLNDWRAFKISNFTGFNQY